MKNPMIYVGVAAMLWVGLLMYTNKALDKREEMYEQLVSLHEASTDSLRTYYDQELQQHVAERKALVAEKAILEDFVKTRDKQVYDLIKKYDAVAGAIASMEIRVDTVVAYDTVYTDTANHEVRKATLSSEHYNIGISSYHDRVELKPLVFYNKQTMYLDKDGMVKVRNTNPYMTVTELQGFRIEQPKQKNKFWRGVAIGAGVVAGGILILK